MRIDESGSNYEGDQTTYCEDCRILTEALRDMEQQCREAEDERFQEPFRCRSGEYLGCEENRYLTKLYRLQRRRDCALEVLLKHQSLEHGSE